MTWARAFLGLSLPGLLTALGCAHDVELFPAADAESAPGAAVGGSPGGIGAGPWTVVPGSAGWTHCHQAGLLELGRNEDLCDFEDVCAWSLGSCGFRSVVCMGRQLYMGTVIRNDCVPSPPVPAAVCSAPSDACCSEFWDCGLVASGPGRPLARICPTECTREIGSSSSNGVLIGCPADVAPIAWPPSGGLRCEGSFVCDTRGYAVDSGADFTFSYEPLYGCLNGIVVAIPANLAAQL
jgi:hypothetical protein